MTPGADQQAEQEQAAAEGEADEAVASSEQDAVAADGDVLAIESGAIPEAGSLDGMQLAQAGTDSTEMASGAGASTDGSTAAASADAADSAVAEASVGGVAAAGAPVLSALQLGGWTTGQVVAASAAAVGVIAVADSGGGSSSSTPSTPTTTAPQTVSANGKVVDGNVKGATIFYDANNNGKLDAGEVSTVTDGDGSYKLDYTKTDVGHMVVLAGGIDTLTGQTVGYMSAPAGMTGVNPFTTLLAASPGLTQEALLAKLGLTGLDVNNYDPIAAMKSGDGASSALAQKAFTMAQQIYAVIQAAAELKTKADGGTTDLTDITTVASAIVNAITAPSADPNNFAATLSAATTGALNAALAGTTPSAELTALKDSLSTALDTVNKAIADSYSNLASALHSGADLTSIVAVAGLSQSALIDAVKSGDTGSLGNLGDADVLKDKATAFAASNLTTDRFVSLSEAELVYTHGYHYNYSSDISLHLTTEQAKDILTPEDLVENSKALKDVGIDHLVINDATADALVAAGLHFVEGDDVKLQAEHTQLTTTLKELQTLGVDSVYGGGIGTDAQKVIAVGLGGVLGNEHVPVFADADTKVVLKVADSDVANLAASAQALATAGIDIIDFKDNTGTLNVAQATEILDNGLKFAAADTITLSATAGELPDVLSRTPELKASHFDIIDVVGNTADLTDAQADALVEAGLKFAADDNHINLVSHGTHVATSLTEMQKLGVDSVTLQGNPTGTLHVMLGGALGAESLPVFEPGRTVSLGVEASQLADVVSHAAALNAAGIDIIDMVGDTVRITDDQANALADNHLRFAASDDVTYVANNVLVGGLALEHAAEAAAFGIDHIDSTDPVHITEDMAINLIDAGLNFIADDQVTVHVTEAIGTHMQTSLADLQQLGVDSVTSDESLVVAHVGDVSVLAAEHVPVFAEDLDVRLLMTANDLDTALDHAAKLAEIHVDEIELTSNDVTAISDLSGADLVDALDAAGIAALYLGTEAEVSMTDLQAQALLDDGKLKVVDEADITIVDNDGGTLGVTLAELAMLDVDHVDVKGATAADVIVNLGLDLTNENVNAELEKLLQHFNDGQPINEDTTPIFSDNDNVKLDLHNVDVTKVSVEELHQLKLLGIDELMGLDADHDGHPDTKQTS